jgi:outer membrane protein assembly factor BamB
MSHGGCTAIAISCLLALPAADAAWLTDQHDSLRTGAADGPGPAWDDVSYSIPLTGKPSLSNTPILRDGVAYVVIRGTGANTSTPGKNGIDRIELATGTDARLADLPGEAADLAADAEGLVATGYFGVIALTYEGAVRWTWSPPSTPPSARPDHVATGCFEPTRGDAWYVNCIDYGAVVGPAGYRPATSFVVALTSGEGRELWTRSLSQPNAPADPQAFAADPVLPPPADTFAGYMGLYGATLVVEVVEEGARPAPQTGALTRFLYIGIDVQAGQVLWTKSTSFSNRATPYASPAVPLEPPACSWPTGDANIVYVKMDAEVTALNARQGTVLWHAPIRQADTIHDYGWVAFAFQDGLLVAPAAQSVTAFDVLKPDSDWRYALPAQWQGGWNSYDTIISGNAVLLSASQRGAGYEHDALPDARILALDRSSGHLMWSFNPRIQDGITNRLRMAADGELLVVTDSATGNLTVIGTTPQSLGIHAAASPMPPQPGETIHVDLSATTPGRDGPATEYRVDWGDGSVSDWQPSPGFDHAYAQKRQASARLFVRNTAGQTSSSPFLFDVGAPRLNFLQDAFSADHENATFFVIGLVFTLAGGAVGFLRLRRRRLVLHRELRAVDRAYEGTKDRVAECELALAERRAHAHTLLQDGKLDETKFGLLEKRIEALQRKLRTDILDERFDYLPRGLARRLEDLLADGTVTAWEREAFDQLLDADKLLSTAQKRKVRRLVAGWTLRDAVAGAAPQRADPPQSAPP